MEQEKVKPILLLHGALGCAADFAPLQAALNGRLPSVALDFPGHGQLAASNPERFSIEEFAETINRYASGTQPLDIFGYSMGGYVALYFAAVYPSKVQRIFTLGTKMEWTPESGKREASRLNPQKILEKVPRFAAMLAQKHGPDHWEKNVQRTSQLLQALGDGALLHAESLGNISAGVCIARGAQDNMVSEEECLAAQQMIAQARYMSIPDQPHTFEQCNMDLIADHLIEFFNT